MMAFLGVGFFAGIKATSPDMVDTIDRYYKEQNIYDLEIVSTLGLTNEDLNEIAKIDGIDQVEGTYEKDAIIENDNEEIVVKLLCANNINVPVVLEGNLPINEDECVVEDSFLKKKNKKIGDYIDLKVEDSTNDNGDKVNYLKQNKLKIVGTVKNLILCNAVGRKECCNIRLELFQLHIVRTGITKAEFKQRLSLRHLLHKCFRYIKLEHTGVVLHIHNTADGISLLPISQIHFYGLPYFCRDFKIIKKRPFCQNFISSLRKRPGERRFLPQFHPVGVRILQGQNAVTIAGGTVIL